ncbi:SgcJ/EcaC family oxidoreductase [Streptomyces sp. NBC_00987]|uniref:SgcJ/EcaC family oxidoreductase n=1 Tax=Streptomyces sp. NBC_00987 TaxID=2903703 RepID=UPI003865E813|nr:SgcJ/EcaC family oxidoreductase [Streptomyces sp. NBC_00987]
MSHADQNTTTQTDVAVRELLDRFQSAWTSNDADAVAEMYTEDATLVMTGLVLDSKDAIREFMRAAFDGPMQGSRPLNEPRIIRRTGADTAVVVSDLGILLDGQTALAESDKRVATFVLARADGVWRVTAYHNCPA